MSDVDLFGQPIPAHVRAKTKWARPKGYAAPPGTGPAGETCKTCRFAAVKSQCSKRYYGCLKLLKIWTSGPGTDIVLRSPACRHWEAKPAA